MHRRNERGCVGGWWVLAAAVVLAPVGVARADAPVSEEESAPRDVAAAIEEHSVAATLVLPYNYLSGAPWDIGAASRAETIEVLSRPLPPVNDTNRSLPAVQVIEQVAQRRIVCLNPGPDDPADDFAGIGYATRLKRVGTYEHFMQRGKLDAMATVGGVLVGLITVTSEIGRPVAASFLSEAEEPEEEPTVAAVAMEPYFVDVLLVTRDYILLMGIPVDDEDEPEASAATAAPAGKQKGLFDRE